MPGELLDPEGIIHQVVSVTITGSMPAELLDPEGIIHPVVIVKLTTGWMISFGSNSSPAEALTQ
jgi:hypothetical protein